LNLRNPGMIMYTQALQLIANPTSIFTYDKIFHLK